MASSSFSFDKYIDNPGGEGSSFASNRSMYKNMYKDKFNKVLVREQGRIEYTVYRTGDTEDSYLIHMKIPSEVIEKFYYDVVVRLFTKDNALKSNASLREYRVQFYSNDPAFVYTFTHAFAKHNMIIEDLKPKMTKESLRTVAKVKNPNDNVWYVKSLYFAYLTMEKYSLFNRPMLNQHAIKYTKRTLLQNVMPAAEKVKLRQEAAEKLAKEERESKLKAAKAKEDAARTSSGDHNTKQIKKTSMVGSVKHIKSTKPTKRSKRTGNG